jgi:5'-3' exonuclease
MMDKVLLIDAHNAMWRASVGFGPPIQHVLSRETLHCACGAKWDMTDSKCYGEKYVQIYNFFRNLRPIIEQFEPDKCFFVLEGHPQFRYDLFADYKANRLIKQAATKEQQAKFLQSKDEIVRILQHFPITVARAHQYEADDVISTLCHDMKSEELTILSNDSDYIQLLQKGFPSCQIYNPIKKTFMEAPAYPYVAWKCLNGDKSDNIPALLKPKKALDTVNNPDLFRKFMSVEENRANFSVSRQLIEFRSVPGEEIILHEGIRNWNLVKQEFARMEFQSIINDKSWIKYTKTFDCLRY